MDFDSEGRRTDTIDLSHINAKWGMAGNQGFDFIGTADFSETKGELRYQQNANNAFIMGDNNGDGIADFLIRLAGTHDLQADHFIL